MTTTPGTRERPPSPLPMAGAAAILSRRISATWVERALMVGPIGAVVVFAYHYRWTFDDGFIYYRTVDQILAGNGPVFNAGERVESFSSPAWLTALTLGDLLSPLRLEYVAIVLSIGATAAGLGLATAGSARLARAEDPSAFRMPIGLIVLASLWPVWIWATSGLEVGLTFAWLGSCWFILSAWATTDRPSTAAPIGVRTSQLVILGLGWLVRPELAVSSIAYVTVVVAMSGAPRRQRWRMVLTAAAVPTMYQLFRMGFYGMLVASPAIAKEGSEARAGRGWNYLVNFVKPYGLVTPLLVIVAVFGAPMMYRLWVRRNGRHLAVILVMGGSGVAHAAYVVLAGGDYAHARLLLPALFAFLLPFLVVTTARRTLGAVVATLGWASVCAVFLRPPLVDDDALIGAGYFGRSVTYEDRGFDHRGLQPWIDGPGLYLASSFDASGYATGIALADPTEIAVAAQAIGVNGYVLGPEVRVIDLHGLADPLIGHQYRELGRLPGHEKLAYAPWLVARMSADAETVMPTDLSIPFVELTDPLPLEYMESVAWAQAALECDAIARLDASYRSPMSVSRVLTNIWHSTSNTTLRISRDPAAAYSEHCGSGTPSQVAVFRDRYEVLDQLRDDAAPGALVVLEDCRAVFLRTADPNDPWLPIEAITVHLDVAVDATDGPRVDRLAVVGPFGADAATISVETDGLGNYRGRLDIEWFPPDLQEWVAIPDSGIVNVTISPDLERRTWVSAADGVAFGALPMVSDQTGSSIASVPDVVASGDGGTGAAEPAMTDPSPPCQAAVDRSRAPGG